MKPPPHLDVLLAGAVLTELLLREAITLRGTRITVARPEPPADPVLADALTRLRASRGRSLPTTPHDWVREVSAQRPGRACLDLLAARGLLDHRRGRLGVLGDRWKAAPGWPERLASRVEGAIRPLKGAPYDNPRDAQLAALIGASGFVRRLPGAFERRHAHGSVGEQAMDLAFDVPIADATREVLQTAGSGAGSGIDITDDDWGFLNDGNGGGDGGGGTD
ncbi:GPP34 family phosphoprotein [Streptomyces sp. NPDC004284]|uniref:GOLPH3/VPS74 family protein n=1 Tax=Streptomyces sp. NPDC004284 TaxID=3364695 RepID=UPI0036A166E3